VPPREWRVRIEDILDAAARIARYVERHDDVAKFISDELTVDAVSRCFGIIGEAVTRLPEAVQASHPEIPWAEMRGLRNIVVHEYFGVTTRRSGRRHARTCRPSSSRCGSCSQRSSSRWVREPSGASPTRKTCHAGDAVSEKAQRTTASSVVSERRLSSSVVSSSLSRRSPLSTVTITSVYQGTRSEFETEPRESWRAHGATDGAVRSLAPGYLERYRDQSRWFSKYAAIS